MLHRADDGERRVRRAEPQRAVAAGSGMAPPAAPALARRPLHMLYVPRLTTVRAITNEPELHESLRRAVPHLSRVQLDTLPIVEQMRTVSEATSMVAAFGQALTWMIMMTPPPLVDGWKIAGRLVRPQMIVELAPQEAFWKKDYEILAEVLQLGFSRVFGTLVDEQCVAGPAAHVAWQKKLAAFNRWLYCNMTIPIAKAVTVVEKMARSERQFARAWRRATARGMR